MLSTTGQIIFSLVIAATVAAFLIPVYRYIKIIRAGQPEKRSDHLGKRISQALSKVLFQRCTLKRERVFSGFMHVFIFYGALTFDTMTINHSLEGYIPNFFLFGNGVFGDFFSLIVDTFAILVLVGVAFFAFRRFIIKPKAYATTPLDSGIIYLALTLVTLSYLYFEMFAIAHHPETERLSFLGSAIARSITNSGMDAAAINSHVHFAWWLHVVFVFGFIAYVPHSKYFHMFAGPFNLVFTPNRPLGELDSLDIENSETFGIEKTLDYTWKDHLDVFACMECGRCQDVCPAFNSDKPLSPKMIIFNLREHLKKKAGMVINKQRENLNPLMEGVYTEGEIWTCTTCGACMHVCPVEIEHIRKIIGVRQGQVLMESKFPAELNNFFRNMETNSNPWGIGFAERTNWADGLDVKLMSEKPDADYLFWVGCAGSFDEEGKKIARAMVKILNKANIDFAILGTEEKCCGDSAKRLGNEYLFQMQAGENIESFKKYKVKKIIVICPHGFHVFRNEYPHLFDKIPGLTPEDKESYYKIEVIHHVQLIADLIKNGTLSPGKPLDDVLTYHDSCYLGRHNDIIDEPRYILSRLNQKQLNEMTNNRKHSFCCGAGGGLMWTEENLGIRVNHMRTDEVIASKADTAVTSCPFCLTMIQDGLKDKQNEETKVKDIAQLVADTLSE